MANNWTNCCGNTICCWQYLSFFLISETLFITSSLLHKEQNQFSSFYFTTIIHSVSTLAFQGVPFTYIKTTRQVSDCLDESELCVTCYHSSGLTACFIPWQWAADSDSGSLAGWWWTSPSRWAPGSPRSGRAGTGAAWCPFPPAGSCAASQSSQRWRHVPPVDRRTAGERQKQAKNRVTAIILMFTLLCLVWKCYIFYIMSKKSNHTLISYSCGLVSGKCGVCAPVYHQVWSFGDPVPGVPRAVVFPCQDDEGNAVSLIAISCLEDIQLITQTGRGHVISSRSDVAEISQLVWSEHVETDTNTTLQPKGHKSGVWCLC